MKRTLTSTVGVFVTIALVAAFFSPSPALARGSEPGSSGSPVSADVSLRSGTVLQDRLFRESSLLPAYFLAYGLDASDLGTVGLRRTAAPSRPVVVDGQLDSMALPVHINGSDMPHERDAAVESWAHESPDIASAAYYTPTLKTVSGAGTVVFTNTLDDPFTVTIWLTSAFNDEITLAYSPAPSGTIAACAVGHQRFNLGAYKGGLPIPYYGFSSAAMALVTIQYADSDVVGLTESELALRYWNPQSVQWQDAHRLCEPERSSVLDTDRNTLTVSPCSLSYFPGSLASFYGEPTVGPSPLTVVFTNTSFGDVNEYLWAFGDGVTSSTESPTHTYTLPGVYTVTLTASNGATNTNTLTRTSYITAYEPAVAGFVATPLSGERPLTVTFTNTSTGSFSESYWQFGDGNVSSTQSPTHTYAAAGVYTVSLRVSGIGGTDTVTRTSYITVDHMTVFADFVGAPTSGPRSLTVAFTNTSTGDYDTSAWTFGDGGSSSSTNPSYTYTAAGTYTVTLTVSGLGGSDTHTETSYITVAYMPVSAAFSGSPTSGVAPLNVDFSNTSTGDFDTSDWDFGDGGSSTVTSPSYTYTVPGVYTVTLTASGLGGADTLTRTSYITVYEEITADFVGSPTSGERPLTVVFTNTSTGDYSLSSWDFGDISGMLTDQTVVTHTYDTAGVYTVTLTSSGVADSDTVAKTSYITVSHASVTAGFIGSPTSGERPLTVVFTNTSTGDFSTSSWDFGDGITSSVGSPTHTYTTAGVYTVSLTVSGLGGADNLTRTSYISVSNVPVAAVFTGTPTLGVLPLNVNFTNGSTGDYTTSAWDFGDGGSSTETSPSYTYTTAGIYTVTLTVSGPGGTDTHTRTSYITALEAGGTADIDPTTSGTVVFTTSTGSTLSFLISNASVAVSTTLVFAEVPTTTVPPSPFLFGNIAFVLEAFVDGVLVPHYTFLKPVALTVNYTDADVQGLDENTLRLYYWDETTSTWADIASTCTPSGNYLRYPGYNQLTVSFCHLCTVGLAEGPSAPVHLPIVVKE
jgi:PKD repeat protein